MAWITEVHDVHPEANLPAARDAAADGGGDYASRPAAPWRRADGPAPWKVVLRHPLIFACVAAACVAGAWGYVRTAVPLYTSTASMRVLATPPPLMGPAEPAKSIDEITAFLNAEMAVLTSGPVVEAAIASPTVRAEIEKSPALAAVLTQSPQMPDPVANLKKAMRAAVGRKDALLSVEYDAPSAQGAAAVVNSLVEAYAAQQSRQGDELNRKFLAILTRERADCDARSHELAEAMLKLVKQGGGLTLDARDRGLELSAARAGLRAAQADAAAAEQQSREATAALGAGPALAAELEKITLGGTGPAYSESESSQIRTAILDLELRKQELTSHTDAPSKLQAVGVQRQLDLMRVKYAASARARMAFTQTKAEKLQAAVAEQELAARDQADAAARYAQADLELKRLDHNLSAIDERTRELRAREGMEGLQVTVVERARAAARPSKPDVPRVMGLAGVAGVALGAVAAYLRESALRRRAVPRAEVVMVSRPMGGGAAGTAGENLPAGGKAGAGGVAALPVVQPTKARRPARGNFPRAEAMEADRVA